MISTALHYVVVAGIFWAVFCRARVMTEDTAPRLRAQYGALLIGAVLSLPGFPTAAYGDGMLGLGICVYLWLDARRWRYGVPR